MRSASIAASLALAAVPALADAPRIVTDIPVTHGLVSAIAGDAAEVTVLLEGAADPHSFQMRPSQARALAEADLVIWVGPELAPWLERALDANAAGVPALTLLRAEGTYLREIGAEGHHDGAHGEEDHAHDDHAKDDDHGHDDHGHEDHGHDDHGEEAQVHAHEHDGLDPHAWLDPANAALWAGAIAAALSEAVPGAADGFAERAGTLAADIALLENELAERLAPLRDRHLVFQHDAYGYLTGHFALDRVSAIADVDGVDPGAGHVATLAAATDIACVFGEVGQNQRLPERLSRDLGTGFAVLDPTGAEVAPGPGHYRALMTALAAAMTDCAAPRG